MLVFNKEFLVRASHQLALTTFLPFVHTARHSYRLNDSVKCSDRGNVGGSLPAISREVHWTLSIRGRRSRNKVSVGEPAEGSLSKPAQQNDPRTHFKHRGRRLLVARLLLCLKRVRGSFCCAGFDNDPSAGSPTETLLRLLLPLNDKVQWTSRDVTGSEPPTSPRSEHFTGSFNP